MLMTLATLQILELDLFSWNKLYTDLPSRQLKIPVKNKSMIICSEDESKIISPIELQNEIDLAVSLMSLGRCFVRPSGTEDVVRIYAECEIQQMADDLANQVVEIIKRIVG